MKKLTILLLSILMFGAVQAQDALWWAGKPEYARYAHQLRLIDSLHAFCTHELKLNVGNNFYNTWISGGDSMFIYLYVSQPDTIALPDIVKTMVWAFEREDSAIATSKKLNIRGYHTLVYKTAGTSGAFLNYKLLSYPDEAIAFIVFHEAVHRHVGQMIDYNYVEALCDAVANRATVMFAEKTKRLAIHKVIAQKEIIEEAYRFFNSKRAELDKPAIGNRKEITELCELKKTGLLMQANPFVKDRMNYPINNAYFIRLQPYAIHYFEMYDGLGDSIDISQATTGLPGAEPAKGRKELKLNPNNTSNPIFDWGR